jgi:hypothetical protein
VAVPVFVTFEPGLVVSGVLVSVVTCPVGVTVTVDAEPLLMAAAPAFNALELMIAWVADAVPVSPASVFQIRCSSPVRVPREAGGKAEGLAPLALGVKTGFIGFMVIFLPS